jgi:electron transfer flavoprotein beta subunit
MLAGLLNWPQLTFISKLELTSTSVTATREIDQGLEIVQTQLPAVISVDLRLNQPRYASLPNIMKAKQKPLSLIEAASLGVTLTPHLNVLQVQNPAARASGMIVDSVQALLDKLQNEAGVLS